MAYRTVIGCCEGDSNPKIFIPRLVQLYKEGRFPIDKIITKYPFEQLEQAREDSNAGKVIKAVVTMEQAFKSSVNEKKHCNRYNAFF